MKKNLAKKIVLGLLTGAVLMSSSVAWAAAVGFVAGDIDGDGGASRAPGEWSVTVGYSNAADGVGSIAIGHNSFATGNNSIVIGSNGSGMNSDDGDKGGNVGYDNCIVIGSNSNAGRGNSVALGNGSKVYGTGSVALGYGSYVGLDVENVVSVGSGGSQYITAENAPATRKIINVTKGEISETSNEVVVGSQLYETNSSVSSIKTLIESDYYNKTQTDGQIASAVNNKANEIKENITGYGSYSSTNYVTIGDTLTSAVGKLDYQIDKNADAIANVYTKEQSDARYMKIAVSDNVDVNVLPTITVDNAGQMIFGTNSSWIDGDGEGFFAGRKDTKLDHTADNARASMTEDGTVTAEKFIIKGANNNEINVETELNKKADKESVYTKTEVDNMLGGSSDAISGINQRLDKTNAKINKVGAGAAALAALHPLEYDPDDKLTFSAGMGNYAGENAAALGAFYRPNEKFMVSLGGTMGNGENMVNLGLSIGLDKPNGYAKLSKRELIQKVNAMEAKYEAVEAEKEAMKAEMAEMKAMLQAILAKK